MRWLKNRRINRAAKEYALKLPKRLKDGWGFSEYYTPGQISVSVKKLGLDPNYIALGYARFLPENQFNQLRSEMPIQLSYEDARAAFIRYVPIHLWTKAWEPAREEGAVAAETGRGDSGGGGSD
jgi:hypothetical protein